MRQSVYRRALKAFILMTFIVTGSFSGALSQSRGVALVIGNTEYGTDRLANASNDAADVAKLMSQLGFDVVLKQDIGLEEFRTAVHAFGKSAQSGKMPAMFYFSGHGMQVNNENYLVPVDATTMSRGDIGQKTVALQSVYDAVGSRGAPNIFIIDACRVDPFAPNPRGGLAIPLNAPPDSWTAFSTSPGNVASDGTGTHSPFTRAFLRYANSPGQSTNDLILQVRADVEANTDNFQVPWDASTLVGNVMLRDPIFFQAQLLSADDDALILLNGQQVLDWNQDGRNKKSIKLQGGTNDVVIKVYNQRSYTGGIPGLGGHLPEGWNYTLSLTQSNGDPLITLVPGRTDHLLSGAEDHPVDNGPRHGKLFTVATMKIVVDDDSNKLKVLSLNSDVWMH